NEDTFFVENIIRFGGCWTVRAFNDEFGFDITSIFLGELTFKGSRDKHIAGEGKQFVIADSFAFRIANYAACTVHEIDDIFNIQPVSVVNPTFNIADRDNGITEFFGMEGGIATDIPKALNGDFDTS